MTPYPAARFCYVTHPEPDTFILNLQFDPGEDRVTDIKVDGTRFERVRISREQLSNLIKDAVVVL